MSGPTNAASASSTGPSAPTAPTPGPSKVTGSSLRAVVAVIIVIALVIVGLGLADVVPGFHLLDHSTNPNRSVRAPATYSVTFGQTGLPAGTTWSVTLNKVTQELATATLSFPEANGSYAYTVGAISGYSANPSSGSVTVAGQDASVSVTFTASSTSAASSYSVSFTETGLPTGTSWSVTLAGVSSGASAPAGIPFHEANGSYAFTVGGVTGFTPSPDSGTVPVHGAAVDESITFTANPPGEYVVTFDESGLPVGTYWSVSLGGATKSSYGESIVYAEPDGSYAYLINSVGGYTPSVTGGTVLVAGAATTVSITFTAEKSSGGGPAAFPVSFSQSGFLANLSWAVEIVPGATLGTPGADVFGAAGEGETLEMGLPNGTYSWIVDWNVTTDLAGITATPGSGNFTVDGAGLSVLIAFQTLQASTQNYTVTVSETGLPAGTLWAAVVNSSFNFTTAGAPIQVALPNGSYYAFAYAGLANYAAIPFDILFDVAGAPVSVVFHFAYVDLLVFNGTGVGNATPWEVEIGPDYAEGLGPANVSFDLPNGTYTYQVEVFGYTASPSEGSVTLAGTSVNESISFSPLATYPVTFTETGLPAGTNWSVDLLTIAAGGFSLENSSNGTSLVIPVPAGNYSWIANPVFAYSGATYSAAYWADTSAGGLAVSNAGESISVAYADNLTVSLVGFLDEAYATLGENGPPNGTSWSVTIDGNTTTGSGAALAVLLPVGTFNFTVHPPAGYSVLPQVGTITLAAAGGSPGAEVLLEFFAGPPPAPPRTTGPVAPGVAGPSAPVPSPAFLQGRSDP